MLFYACKIEQAQGFAICAQQDVLAIIKPLAFPLDAACATA